MISLSDFDFQKIKEKIIAKSKELKIDKIGFTTAEPFNESEKILLDYRNKGYSSGFEEKDIKKRIYPQLSLPEAQSIIAIAMAYPAKEPSLEQKDVSGRGEFCRASWGMDYHRVLKEKLSAIDQFIKELVPGTENLIMVDTGALSDRAVAARAGLGWIGKNGSLITPEFGSFVYLGELLTTLPLPADKPLERECGNCSSCFKVCPLGAILPEGKIIDCRKCLAFQTLNKGQLTNTVKEKIGENKYIYGCDLCQLVCPHNNKVTNNWHDKFKSDYELIKPDLKGFLKLSNREFKEKYGQMAGSWRGKKVLERNAIFILGKHRDEEAIPLLKEILFSDPRPDIRSAAAWSIGNFQRDDTERILKEALKNEKDAEVKKEINNQILKAAKFS